MEPFARRRGELHAEEVALAALAAEVGTPAYVYSATSFASRYRAVHDAFAAALGPLDPLVAYSVKACSSLGVLARLAKEGAAFDVVSGGELIRVARAGGDPTRVIFAGVGKRDDELALAIEADVFQVNVESASELARLDRIASAAGRRARAALRVNPGLDPKTHRFLATGAPSSKFGIAIDDAAVLLRDAARWPHVEIVGLHVHLGSMLRDADLYARALDRIDPLVALFPARRLRTIDLGGGFAIETDGEPSLDPRAVAAAIAPKLLALGARPIFEPGRWIAAPSGCLVTRVLDRKVSGGRTIVIVDAGMNDLLRPALYGAKHPIATVAPPAADLEEVDVVGPVCESGDFLALGVRLPRVEAGDLLAVLDAGAYGFSMASSYNTRPRPPEVLVEGASFRVIRRRESLDDLLRGESA